MGTIARKEGNRQQEEKVEAMTDKKPTRYEMAEQIHSRKKKRKNMRGIVRSDPEVLGKRLAVGSTHKPFV